MLRCYGFKGGYTGRTRMRQLVPDGGEEAAAVVAHAELSVSRRCRVYDL